MPTALGPKQFSIDSTLELVADHYTAELPDSAVFLQANRNDIVTLGYGLLDSAGNPLIIGRLEEGPIDEYELTITPDSLGVNIRGRDPSAKALDGTFRKRYIRFPPKSEIEKAPPLPNIPEVPTVVGIFTAAQIAAEAVGSVGLSLSWGAPNYEIRSDFDANGRVIDIVRQLVQPWTLVEPFRADIFLEGQTLIVRPRQFPIVGIDYSLTLQQTRRSLLTVRKRPARKIGQLILTGQRIGVGIEEPTGPIRRFGPGTVTERATSEKFDVNGILINRVETETTYRTPERSMLRQVKTTFNRAGNELKLSARETIINEWTTVSYDESGPVTQPQQKTQQISREGYDSKNVFTVLETEETGFSYDSFNFQTGSATVKRRFDSTKKQLVNFEQVVKTLSRKGTLLVEEITERYTFDSKNNRWVMRQRDRADQAGHPPGGPGRGGVTSTGGDGVNEEPVIVSRVISSDVDAVDVSYQNEHLTRGQLEVIAAQFQQASGLWEYEVVFDGVAMPWLTRGITLQFTDILLEGGVPLVLPPLLVTEVRSAYDEGSDSPTLISRCRAFGWSAT